jgi:ParB family transcriptional regulator, chromosome partitioning protein
MTNTETPTQPRLIAASLLAKSPLNARKTESRGGIEELKASILSHGLMQNLVVTDSERDVYHVIAGGRRLQAIHALQFEGKLPQDYAVPCQIVSETSAREMSLAENVVRLAMHPADQFETFAALIEEGHTTTEVAARFGIEETLVHKRMKLARVAPELFAYYRDDQMTLECLIAFTVTDDHGLQLQVYESLQGWQKNDPGAIRDALTEEAIEASSKLARFVGLDAYIAAGGATRTDLFGEETYLEDPELLQSLAEKKLDAIRKELEAKGWGWIEINPERDYSFINRCKRLRPQLANAPRELLELKDKLDAELEANESMLGDDESDESLDEQQAIRDQLDDVEEKLAEYVGFDEEQKQLAGCFVSIGQDGTPSFDMGLVKPEHRRQLSDLTGMADETVIKKAKPKHAMPQSLRTDLAAERLPIAQLELLRHPAIAFDLLVFQVASVLLAGVMSVDAVADVHFQKPRLQRSEDWEPSPAKAAFAALAESIQQDWLKLPTEAERFEAFRSLPEASKMQLLAYSLAVTLKPRLATATGENRTAYDLALSLTSARVSEYWRPTSENFFGRLSRDQLLAVGREVFGDGWAHSRASEKKGLLVGQLHRAFANPEKSGRTPEQIERLNHWLPECMRFNIESPEASTTKARKAA